MSNVERIEIIISGDSKGGQRALKETNKGLTNLKDVGAEVKTAVAGVAAGLGTVYAAGKTVYNWAKSSAELEYAAVKFDRLAGVIGTTGEALEDDLMTAVDGLMSKADTMVLAGDLMSLGLAKTHDQAVRLTTVVSQLGMDMNQLTLTLSNQTTMRFDSLGVAVDGFDEKLEALEAQGYSTNDAFTEAFLQQAEEQIEKVGSVADESLGTFMRFEAALENAGDAAKNKFLPPMTSVLENWAFFLTMGDQINDMFDDAVVRVENNSESYEEYTEKMLTAAVAANKLSEGEANLIREQGLGYAIAKNYADQIGLVTEREYQEMKQKQHSADMWAEYAKVVGTASEAVDDYSDNIDEAKEGIAGIVSGIEDQIAAEKEKIKWAASGGNELVKQIEEINANYSNLEMRQTAVNEALYEYVENMADVDSMTLDQIAQEFIALGVEEATAYAYAGGIRSQLLEIDGTSVDAYVNIHVSGRLPNINKLRNSSYATVTTNSNSFRDQSVEQFKALGGPVEAGVPYWVGDLGPEVFIPYSDGEIVPNNKANKATGNYSPINVNIQYAPTISTASPQELEANLLPLIDEAIRIREREI